MPGRAAGVCEPLVEVVGFGPGGWAFVAGPTASDAAGHESRALLLGEEALREADVDALSVVEKCDWTTAPISYSATPPASALDRPRPVASASTAFRCE